MIRRVVEMVLRLLEIIFSPLVRMIYGPVVYDSDYVKIKASSFDYVRLRVHEKNNQRKWYVQVYYKTHTSNKIRDTLQIEREKVPEFIGMLDEMQQQCKQLTGGAS